MGEKQKMLETLFAGFVCCLVLFIGSVWAEKELKEFNRRFRK